SSGSQLSPEASWPAQRTNTSGRPARKRNWRIVATSCSKEPSCATTRGNSDVSVAPQLKRAAEVAMKTLHIELVEGAPRRRDREPIRIWGGLGENLERAHPAGRQLVARR
ncbi:MAG: hypothetical protein ACK56I_35175, partial [bacterium]